MSEEIKSPTFPESVADGTIANWVKKEGEAVSQDEVIAEIETDKVVLEVLAPSDGKISKIHKNEGDTVLSAELIGEFQDQQVAQSFLTKASTLLSVIKDSFISDPNIALSIKEENFLSIHDLEADSA